MVTLLRLFSGFVERISRSQSLTRRLHYDYQHPHAEFTDGFLMAKSFSELPDGEHSVGRGFTGFGARKKGPCEASVDGCQTRYFGV